MDKNKKNVFMVVEIVWDMEGHKEVRSVHRSMKGAEKALEALIVNKGYKKTDKGWFLGNGDMGCDGFMIEAMELNS